MINQEDLLYKIAKAYYYDGLTQNIIGKKLGLSRIKVSRLLQQARDEHVVEISVTPPTDSFTDLECELAAAYDLDEVVLVPTPKSDQRALLQALGRAAAECFMRSCEDGQVVALSWGYTMRATVDAIPRRNMRNVQIVQMLGGLGNIETEILGGDLVHQMALRLGAQAKLLPSPGIVKNKQVRDALMNDLIISDTLQMASHADIALLGIGTPAADSIVVHSGILTQGEIDELHAIGAVGDMAMRYYNSTGRAVDHPINDRIVGLDLGQIRGIPRTIGVAGGRPKYPVIRGALQGRLLNVLVTDSEMAQQLLMTR